jgi:hypothetical protein
MNAHMRSHLLSSSLCLLLLSGWAPCAPGQGVFEFSNPNAPTYVGTYGGTLAGPGIWGQALVGTDTNSLTPMGFPAQHRSDGLLIGQLIGVLAPPYSVVFVQLAAWDGVTWGTSFASVPAGQLGLTDIVPVELVMATDPSIYLPHFHQSAVVPLVPEPSVAVLALAGMAALWCRTRIGGTRTKANP